MLKRERLDRVVRLVLDAPLVNVLNIELLGELATALGECARDESVAAVLVSGEGRCFSAGASVSEHRKEIAPRMITAIDDACRALEEMPVPTVALVHGSCLGGGLELALSCDFVVADPAATLGQPEIRLAFFPPLACRRLPRVTGYQNAAYLILGGETIDASRAAAMGLVQEILPRAEWEKLSDRLNRLSVPVLRLAKRALSVGADPRREDAPAALKQMFLEQLYQIEDVEEGISSFEGKRKPEWRHR